MNFKGEELVFYDCPECGKHRLLWKKGSPPKSRLVARSFYGVQIKEHGVVCNGCHMKYARLRRKIEKEYNQKLKEKRRGDTTQTLLGGGETKP